MRRSLLAVERDDARHAQQEMHWLAHGIALEWVFSILDAIARLQNSTAYIAVDINADSVPFTR